MSAAEQDQVVDVGSAAVFPVADVVGDEVQRVAAAGEGAATVACEERPPLCRRRGAGPSAEEEGAPALGEESLEPALVCPGADRARVDGRAVRKGAVARGVPGQRGGVDGDGDGEAVRPSPCDVPVGQGISGVSEQIGEGLGSGREARRRHAVASSDRGGGAAIAVAVPVGVASTARGVRAGVTEAVEEGEQRGAVGEVEACVESEVLAVRLPPGAEPEVGVGRGKRRGRPRQVRPGVGRRGGRGPGRHQRGRTRRRSWRLGARSPGWRCR